MSQNLQDILREMVDGILVINLDSSVARYEAFRRAAEGSLPAERVERLSAVAGRELPGYGVHPWFTARTGARAGTWAGAAGCVLSHRKCIETARERGWRSVLLLEDDALPMPPEGAVELLQTAADTLRGAYMLYLGYNRPVPHGTRLAEHGGTGLWRVDGVLATHAYVVTAEAYDTLLAQLPTQDNVWEWMARYRAIDTYYRDYVAAGGLLPVYAVYPTIFRQSGGISEISGERAADNSHSCTRAPYPLNTLRGALYRLGHPFRRIKVWLNSLRTLIRARRGGLPGYRRRAKQLGSAPAEKGI